MGWSDNSGHNDPTFSVMIFLVISFSLS